MNRHERLFAITEALRRAGTRGTTTARLAALFGVSQRTIKRDMASLAASGLPLMSTEGRGGGYHVLPQSHVGPVPLTAGEATALAVAVAAQPHMPFAAEGRTAVDKLYAAMDPSQRAMAIDVASRIWMRSDSDTARPANAAIIDDSLRRRTAVSILYADADGKRTRRTVEPMAIVRTSGQWSLLAWCHLRDDGRWFRLDRISRAWPTNIPCAERDVHAIFGDPPDDAQPAVAALTTPR